MNNRVLIVDGDMEMLKRVYSDVVIYYKDDFTLITIKNGKEAQDILKNISVHLMISDMRIPGVSGFNFLYWLNNKFPKLPVVIMNDFGDTTLIKFIKRKCPYRYLEKPFDVDDLAYIVFQSLEEIKSGDFKGIPLLPFLQVVKVEQERCKIQIAEGKKTGTLFFDNGELIAAYTDKLEGKEASIEILEWENPEIRISKKYDEPNGNIESGLLEIINRLVGKQQSKKEQEQRKGIFKEATTKISEKKKSNKQKEVSMAIEKEVLNPLLDIEGVNAALVYTGTGELILNEISPQCDVNPKLLGAQLPQMFKRANEMTQKLDFGETDSYRIRSSNKMILHKCVVIGKYGLGIVAERDVVTGQVDIVMDSVIEKIKESMG
ncbi:response regulator [candidate division WOR-3 bacterium]|nr:response regulator [candidate division WOR-3 bacterium]